MNLGFRSPSAYTVQPVGAVMEPGDDTGVAPCALTCPTPGRRSVAAVNIAKSDRSAEPEGTGFIESPLLQATGLRDLLRLEGDLENQAWLITYRRDSSMQYRGRIKQRRDGNTPGSDLLGLGNFAGSQKHAW
jgi:hypothetical protein